MKFFDRPTDKPRYRSSDFWSLILAWYSHCSQGYFIASWTDFLMLFYITFWSCLILTLPAMIFHSCMNWPSMQMHTTICYWYIITLPTRIHYSNMKWCILLFVQGYPYRFWHGGGSVPPHRGGTSGGGQGPDGGGLARDSRHFLRTLKNAPIYIKKCI